MKQREIKFEAIYSLHVWGHFSCRIPKVNGKGFLKCALGGHHINNASLRFSDAMQDLGISRDICDVDGYLSIQQPQKYFGKERKNDAELIMKALSVTFPRITKWREVTFDEVAFS